MKRSVVYTILLIATTALALPGCSSLPQDGGVSDCPEAISEHEIGKRDGAMGDPRSRATERSRLCNSKRFDTQYYHRGEQEALQEFYCTPLRAVTLGEHGGKYQGTCPKPLEKRFLKFFKMGQRLTDLRQNVQKASLEKENIIGDGWSLAPVEAQKADLEADTASVQRLRFLEQFISESNNEINTIEQKIARLKEQEQAKKNAPPSPLYLPSRQEYGDGTSQSGYGNNQNEMMTISPMLLPKQARYTEMMVVHGNSIPDMTQNADIDPDSPEFGAYEYENTDRRNLRRKGESLTPPRKNVINEGTTVYIDKDWFPR
ncbi:MAG: DUF2799 domain-containing protein [Pseudomonadota bacterium]